MAGEDALVCLGGSLPVLLFFGGVLILMSVKIIMEYQRGVLFTLGKYSGTLGPGLTLVIPALQDVSIIDIRIKTIDIPKQEVMTKDNVPVSVNAVVYMRPVNVEKAVLKIQDYQYAVAQYGQTALRDVIGNKNLDEVLTERIAIANEIKELVDKETEEWGIDITSIKVQDIELPADMKRAMARQAEAEREKRATIIRSEGEVQASENVSMAATRLGSIPGALHLRTLQTITDVSALDGNTVLFVAPIELLRALEGFAKRTESDAKAGGGQPDTGSSTAEVSNIDLKRILQATLKKK